MAAQVKVAGKSGQISLEKEFAGQRMFVEEIEPGE
jgi:putative transposon-encoded protein